MKIEELVNHAQESWWNSGLTYPCFDSAYDKKNDKKLMDLKTELLKYLTEYHPAAEKSAEFDQIMLSCKEFMIETMGISRWAAEHLFDEDYLECSRSFIRRARETAPELDVNGIFQALRNVWTMNSMQLYMNRRVELTNSMFAYSMLYPLTDNYLDSPNRTKTEKYEFNLRFREKIRTGSAEYHTNEEKRIFDMIDMITGDYDRTAYPHVTTALLAILDGQGLSISQQDVKGPYSVDLLKISIYKGGASVLADAYLVRGDLTDEEAVFSFYYGVLLQLADDLQDMSEDKKSKHSTIFNVQNHKIDESVFKYLNMIDRFFHEIMIVKTDHQKALKEIMSRSLNLLVYTSLMNNKRYLSRSLYRKIKKANMFSGRTYKKVERTFNRQLKKLVAAGIE
ncbi:hypothetical protein DWB64_10710 [Fusibacter sp. A1]|nr:hypothetical protein DWB64_10710 [Fusibacter sp. A1]